MLAQLLNLHRPLLIFDLETTTAKKEVARIVQYAHMIFRPDGSVGEYHTLVDPLVEIPKASSEVHGITDLIIRFGCAKCRRSQEHHADPTPDHPFINIPTFKQLGPSLHRGFQGCDLGGTNINFDIEVLDLHLQRECDLRLDMENVNVIDTHRLWQVLFPRTLSDAYEEFTGKKAEGAHDAMNDVRMSSEVLAGQIQHPRFKLADITMSTLHRHLWPERIDHEGKFKFNPVGEPCFGFGKHKDEPMVLHVDYLRWMKRQGNWSAHVTRIVDDALKGRFPTREKDVQST